MDKRLFEDGDRIDEDSCISIYDGSYDFYRAVLETFAREITKDIDEISRSFEAEDRDAYRILVHGLKGSGASVGATDIVKLATESDELLKKEKWEDAKVYHAPIMKELERLSKLISERLK
ncbi:MAG: Hpt domain-containing protein [Lachnospiraceae bacterium]|nr:Hpt domain-containing protein [Lachnospiraceae bacterium]